MIAQHMDYFMSSHFITYGVCLFIFRIVSKILAFLYTSLMLCENKIWPQFPHDWYEHVLFFHFPAAIFESFGFVSVSILRQGAIYTLRPHIMHPTDNFPISGTSRIYHSANAE